MTQQTPQPSTSSPHPETTPISPHSLITRTAKIVLVTLTICAVAVLLWRLQQVVFLAFAALLLAVIIHHLALEIMERTGMSRRAALLVLALTIVILTVVLSLTLGSSITNQFRQLTTVLPEALSAFEEFLRGTRWGNFLLNQISIAPEKRNWSMISVLTGTFSTFIGVIMNIFIVISVTIFLAANPKTYRDGALALLPETAVDRTKRLFDEVGRGLYSWMLGQLLAMLLVGILAAIGFMIIGLPYPIALGLIVGVTNFIPFLGPYIGGAPAVLVAFSTRPEMVLWAAAVILVVQMIEGNFLTPSIQREATTMPAAIILLAVFAFGTMFGILGVMLATPITFVIFQAIKIYYVEGALGRPVD